MAAKPETPDKEAPQEKTGTAPAEVPVVKTARRGSVFKTWLPAILAILLTPVTCWAVAEFVLMPRLQAKLSAVTNPEAPGSAELVAGHGENGAAHGGKAEGAAPTDTFEFTNVVVNLSGTMGTRYLKTSFVVTGLKPGTIRQAFDLNKDKLTDVTLGVLSSLSLADLEEPGAKNVLREKLISAYNQSLGVRVADQVYFSDFVVQ